MTVEITTLRSRRAILGAGVGAVAATVATALAGPLAVRATNDDPVLVGDIYTASSVTGFDTTGSGSTALVGYGGSGDGAYGSSISGSGVHGDSNAGTGVNGFSNAGDGIYGASNAGRGVVGTSAASDKPAILGASNVSSTGVQGFSSSTVSAAPAAPAKTGVFGYAAQDSSARGVQGQSTVGHGVFGLAGAGIGSRGYSTTGTAGYFSTGGPKSGVAVRAIGRVKLDNCAGIATILSGHNSVVVTPGTDLLSTSAVVATLQGNPGGATTVQRVSVNAVTDTFTIYLTANAAVAVTVAWHVFG